MPGGAGEDLELARPVMATEVGGIRDGGVPANILTSGARLLPAGLLTAVLPACPRSVIVRAPRSCQKATSLRRGGGGSDRARVPYIPVFRIPKHALASQQSRLRPTVLSPRPPLLLCSRG